MKEHISFAKSFTYKEQVSRSLNWGHFFLILNALLAIIIGISYAYAAPKTGSFISFAYIMLTSIGHMAFLTFALFLVVLFPLAFVGNYRYYRVFSVILLIVYHSIILIDIKFFLYIKAHLSLSVLSITLRELDFTTGLNYNYLFIAIPIVIAIELALAKLSTRALYKFKQRNFFNAMASIFVASFVGSHCIHIWADAQNYDEVTQLRAIYPLHHPMTAKSFLSSHGFIEEKGPTRSIVSVNYPLKTIEIDEESQSNLNLIHLQVDNLSYESFVKTQPNYTSLLAHSYAYKHYYLPYRDNYKNFFAASYGLPFNFSEDIKLRKLNPVAADALYQMEYAQRIIAHSGIPSIERLSEDAHYAHPHKFILRPSNKKVFAKLYSSIEGLDGKRNFAISLLLKNSSNLASLCDELIAYLKNKDLFDNTILIFSSLSGDRSLQNKGFDIKAQHGALVIHYPYELESKSINSLASAFDLAPTIGKHIAHIANASSDYSNGIDLLEPSDRSFFAIEEPSLVLISKGYSTLFNDDGKAIVSYDQDKINTQANLENLIEAIRDLNRFKE